MWNIYVTGVGAIEGIPKERKRDEEIGRKSEQTLVIWVHYFSGILLVIGNAYIKKSIR